MTKQFKIILGISLAIILFLLSFMLYFGFVGVHVPIMQEKKTFDYKGS